MFPTVLFSLVLAFVAVVILFKAVRMVPQGTNGRSSALAATPTPCRPACTS